MLKSVILRRACALVFKSDFNGIRPSLVSIRTGRSGAQACPCQFLCHSSQDKKPEKESLPEAPPLTPEEIGFIEELARGRVKDFTEDHASSRRSANLPEAPQVTAEWELDINEDDFEEDVLDVDPVPFIPPVQKFALLPGGIVEQSQNLTTASNSDQLADGTASKGGLVPSHMKLPPELQADPAIQQVLAAWAKAVIPTPVTGPMPLHELANRSTKVKELVKLGVDFSQIAARHGDLERLLHLGWADQIKPHIRFLVDCGIKPENLGMLFTSNTPLLWTDKDDIQVRINYLEAKHFSQDEIIHIINRAPYWLTLSTKELDSRLGFLQRTFKLQGSDVRYVASSFPRIISSRSKKWEVFVDTTKLMDREFGFTPWERKELLMKKASCYIRPSLVRSAFQLCHQQIGLTHAQLVQHASLLVNRASRMKPRHAFLKFLKRDVFNVRDPLYISPDWLWQGTTEEFCEQAAKTSVDDYDTFIKYSTAV